ncbi:hypothetical protein [Clostridium saccharobutylicum]|uniref:Uncharacterized protein n=1 Tax=Clostridium saccharobutylicum TaxID=169679 RepID=A0A1S8MQ67_CLOSA|nr:hypothetical protein [Clostridium saccharobutylicum]OOM06311.1 hypothetical protein CLOSAC_42300 [Clostridium saccharobutylicum]
MINITTPEGGSEKYTNDYAGNSEYFYYGNEGNLTKHIDRNQNHVDRIYNLDRNIVSVKAYQVGEEGFTTTPLSQKHRRRSFTERETRNRRIRRK